LLVTRLCTRDYLVAPTTRVVKVYC